MPRPNAGCDFLVVWFWWAESFSPICDDIKVGETILSGLLEGKVVNSADDLIRLLKQTEKEKEGLLRLAAFDGDGKEMYTNG